MKKMLFPVTTEFDLNLPYYFAGIGYDYEQENINRPDGYPDYQWIQCRSGKGELTLNGNKYIIEKGQGMLLLPDEPHEYHAVDGEWKVDWIIFKGTQIHSFMHNIMKTESSGMYYITSQHCIADKIADLFSADASSEPTKNFTCSSLVYAILMDILRLTSSTQNTAIVNKFDRINSVLSYIDKHFSEQISLSELADTAKLSPEYLCSTFKKSTSQTLFEYINMVRIRKSKELLLSDMQIKEAAYSVGFNDTSYFGLVFKKFEKMTPSEFRALHK